MNALGQDPGLIELTSIRQQNTELRFSQNRLDVIRRRGKKSSVSDVRRATIDKRSHCQLLLELFIRHRPTFCRARQLVLESHVEGDE
jgi:hypothetical protein